MNNEGVLMSPVFYGPLKTSPKLSLKSPFKMPLENTTKTTHSPYKRDSYPNILAMIGSFSGGVLYYKDTEPLCHSLMYSLVSHFFPVSIHHLTHSLLLTLDVRNISY